jgi:thiosulfate sulfurtransferase
MLKNAAREALIITLAAVGIALAVYAVRPDKIGNPSPPSATDATQKPAGEVGYREMAIEDALRWFEDGGAIFADARHAVDFAAGHIKGAVHLSVDEQESWLPDFLATTDPATVIITYCDGEACHLATQLAELLFYNGFDRVYYLKNGWTRWRESGLPIE